MQSIKYGRLAQNSCFISKHIKRSFQAKKWKLISHRPFPPLGNFLPLKMKSEQIFEEKLAVCNSYPQQNQSLWFFPPPLLNQKNLYIIIFLLFNVRIPLESNSYDLRLQCHLQLSRFEEKAFQIIINVSRLKLHCARKICLLDKSRRW